MTILGEQTPTTTLAIIAFETAELLEQRSYACAVHFGGNPNIDCPNILVWHNERKIAILNYNSTIVSVWKAQDNSYKVMFAEIEIEYADPQMIEKIFKAVQELI